MKRAIRNAACLFAIIGVLAPSTSYAGNGLFLHGVGAKAKGMGGAAIAYPQDAFSGAANPATLVFVKPQLDYDFDVMHPVRTAIIRENSLGVPTGEHSGDGQAFNVAPEMAFVKEINNSTAWGISMVESGTGVKYDVPLFGTSKAYSNVAQVQLNFTFAKKLAEDAAIGISPYFAYQRFSLKGLENYKMFSSDAEHVTNNGVDSSSGFGVRIGGYKKLSPVTSAGLFYQTKTNMSRFEKYRGVIAEHGKFNLPENYGVGIAVKANPKTNIAFDVVRINYSDLISLGRGNGTGLMGSDEGPGFGWRSQTVYKLGVEYQASDKLTLRAGYNYAKSPVVSEYTMLNTFAPAVDEHHLTLGATWKTSKRSDFTLGYMHVFNKKVRGSDASSFADVELGGDTLCFGFSNKI
jgi:long-chain fatty acid transport protein